MCNDHTEYMRIICIRLIRGLRIRNIGNQLDTIVLSRGMIACNYNPPEKTKERQMQNEDMRDIMMA